MNKCRCGTGLYCRLHLTYGSATKVSKIAQKELEPRSEATAVRRGRGVRSIKQARRAGGGGART